MDQPVLAKAPEPRDTTIDVQYARFVVGTRPYCLWGTDTRQTTLRFLDAVDPGYFDYVADVYMDSPEDEHVQRAALSLRMAYSQGLETLFAFLGAAIQAPHAVPAWLDLYRGQRDLLPLVEAVRKRRPIYSVLGVDQPRWEDVASFALSRLILDDREKESEIKECFCKLWSRLAGDLLDDGMLREYNSIKHGHRVRPGGFFLAFRREAQPGAKDPAAKPALMGHSEFGSSYYVTHKLEQTGHLLLERHHRNWDPHDLAAGLHLIAMSLQNVASTLKVMNGAAYEDVTFVWPDDLGVFAAPWETAPKMSVTDFRRQPDVGLEPLTEDWSREELLAAYQVGDYRGVLRYPLD